MGLDAPQRLGRHTLATVLSTDRPVQASRWQSVSAEHFLFSVPRHALSAALTAALFCELLVHRYPLLRPAHVPVRTVPAPVIAHDVINLSNIPCPNILRFFYMEEHTCEARVPHINRNVARK